MVGGSKRLNLKFVNVRLGVAEKRLIFLPINVKLGIIHEIKGDDGNE